MNSIIQLFCVMLMMYLSLLESYAQTTAEVIEYYESGDFTGGVDYIREHYKVFENDAYANYLLGEMGVKSKKWNEAMSGYQRALQLIHPDRKMDFHEKIYHNDNEIYWYANDGLGMVYYMLGDVKKSLEALQEANRWLDVVKLNPLDEAMHYYNLACAYSLNKKFDNAVAALHKAIQINPDYQHKAGSERDFASMENFKPFIKLLEGN